MLKLRCADYPAQKEELKTMNITLQFKTRICTEETYPYSFYVDFTRELKIDEYKDEDELYDIIFNNAHEFEKIITKGLKFVDSTTECLGIRFISSAKSYQLLDLARLGIERI